MKKIFQTIVDPGKGNCMQAVTASLFEKELDEVPNFIEYGQDWFEELWKYYKSQGYGWPMCFNIGNKKKDLEVARKALKYDGGINGFFDGTVKSQTFKDVYHAVVVDSNLNIVHDPNPNQKALLLGPKDVVTVYTVKNNWHISEDGKSFVINS